MTAWIVLGLVVLGSIFDLRSREIPDWIPVTISIVGLGGLVLGLDEREWFATVCLAGGAFVLGSLLFRAGGLGGGDVKLLVSLAMALKPLTFFATCFGAAIAGGGLALVARKRGEEEFAYGPAFAVGLGLALLVPDVWFEEVWS